MVHPTAAAGPRSLGMHLRLLCAVAVDCCDMVLPDTAGSTDFMTWNCSFPGKKGTDWEGGTYPVTIRFTANYPSKSPECQ